MLGILLLYFIWNYYTELAFEHDKKKWVYGVIGIATYYAGTFIGGIVIGLSYIIAGNHYIDDSNAIISAIIAMPFGVLSVWGLYKLLKYQWERKSKVVSNSLDNDLLDSNTEA